MKSSSLFSSAKCNIFVILEMDYSDDIFTKLLGLSFSEEENPVFVKYFTIVLLLTLFQALFIQLEADNMSNFIKSLFWLSFKLA